jgi:hypothetical protein
MTQLHVIFPITEWFYNFFLVSDSKDRMNIYFNVFHNKYFCTLYKMNVIKDFIKEINKIKICKIFISP